MRRMGKPPMTPAVLLLLGLPAVAADMGRGDDAEFKAFEATVGRFTNRMEEFQGEVKSEVDRWEAEERRSLNRSYDALLDDYADSDLAMRATAIRRFEEFLAKYPRAPHSAHVMFRLADLYFDETEEDFLAADSRFQVALEKLDENANLDEIPEEPQRDFSKSIALYERIIAEHPSYEDIAGCYYMLAYAQGEQNSVQFDEPTSLANYRVIVDKYGDSDVAAIAHFRIGEYHFDYNDLERAIPHYQAVVELEGEDGSLYDEGLYKLAWTNYRRSNYETALIQLNQLLDWSVDIYKARTGRESSMAPEAIDYTAISIADLAVIDSRSPLQIAQSFYAAQGKRQFEDRVYKRLAKVLEQQAEWDSAIQVYEHLQSTWPDDPENPNFQWQIALLHNTKVPADQDAANAAIAQLDSRFREGSRWHAANRANPDALATARSYIERSLASVAVAYHNAAQDSGQPQDFLVAADTYKRYLKDFPFADDYYEMQWYLASTLLSAGKTNEAEAEFQRLHSAGKHPYHEAALWPLRGLRMQQLVNLYQDHKTLPPGAVVENEVDLGDGKVRKVYALSEAHQRFVETSDALLAADFRPALQSIADAAAAAERISDPDEQSTARQAAENDLNIVEPFAGAVDGNRVAIMYQAAQVLVAHNRYEEARPRLEEIVAKFPATMEASFAARLDVDTYLEEDLLAYRRKVAAYAANPPGPPSEDGPAAGTVFDDMVQKTDFQLATKLVESQQYGEAADAFVDFFNTYPDSEYRPLALRNAANNYERGGNLVKSIQLLEKYVADYPDDENSRPFYFRLAGVYAQSLELERAISYYQTLYDKTRGARPPVPYIDASSALYNAGFLRVGVGDFAGAARNFELYGKAFPDEGDAEQITFMAGEQYERVSDAEAKNFYGRYLRDYGDRNPDHVMEALHAVAKIVERGGNPRNTDQAWDDVSAAFARLAPTGTLGPAGRHYAAHAAFRRLESQLAEFEQIKFTSNDTKNADLLINQKQSELVALLKASNELIETYGDFEYNSAALLLGGRGYLVYSDMLYNAPVPKEIARDDDLLLIFQEELDKRRLPVEEKGRTRLEEVLKQASTKKLWTDYQTQALAILAKRFPGDFAEEKEQFRGDGESAFVPLAGPVRVKKAPAPPPPPPGAPPAAPPTGGTP